MKRTRALRCRRFRRAIALTDHARQRMRQRGVDLACLIDVLDTGQIDQPKPGLLRARKERVGSDQGAVVIPMRVDPQALVVITVIRERGDRAASIAPEPLAKGPDGRSSVDVG